MPNILEDLYYGNISPSERRVRPGSHVKILMQKQSNLESKLTGSFTEEQRMNFEQYISVSADILDANCLDCFATGFRLGALFTHEIFVGTDVPFAALTNDER